MKIIEVEQGSPDWLLWRKNIITATDCASIMGSSPYQSMYKCWMRKKGLEAEPEVNEAMLRGKKLEPEARALFNFEHGKDMKPVCVESSDYPFLGASLDGISSDHKEIVEIKCGGERLHVLASQGMIPEYYIHQMQHQLLVTKAERAYYYSYNGEQGICIIVEPDPCFALTFIGKAKEFWERLRTFNPPLIDGEKEYQVMDENLEWSHCAKKYAEIDAIIKFYEGKKEQVRERLIELCDGKSSRGFGLTVISTTTKGRIAYEEIQELKGVDVEKYRKPSTSSWKLLLEKSKT